jgi:hypothetical protein
MDIPYEMGVTPKENIVLFGCFAKKPLLIRIKPANLAAF